MIKKVILILCLLFIILPIFSLEIELQGHYDNYPVEYSDKNTNIGLSCRFSEQLKNLLFIDANLMYKNAGKYLAYCAGRLSINKIKLRCGIALDIRNTDVTPGFILSFDTKLLKFSSLTSNLLITYTTQDISKGSVFDGDAGIIIHLKNSNVKMLFNFRRELENTFMTTYKYGVLDLTTYESGFPLRIALTAKIGTKTDSRSADTKNLSLEVGGRLELVTIKHGAYFIGGNASLFEKNKLDKTPFAVSVGTRINLN